MGLSCSHVVFSWYSGFPLLLKTSASDSNSIWIVPTLVKRVPLDLVPRKCVRQTFCLYHRGLCCIKFIGVYLFIYLFCCAFCYACHPGGLSYKCDGDACRKIKIKPIRETNVGVAKA